MKKIYPQDLQKLKDVGKKFATITAYDYTSSKIVNDIGFPVVLVGDSASMVVYGYKDTTPVSMDEMMFVLRSVIRGNSSSLIVADMPFMSYQPSIEEAIKNAGKFIKTEANAVKIEGDLHKAKQLVGSFHREFRLWVTLDCCLNLLMQRLVIGCKVKMSSVQMKLYKMP